MRHFTFYILRLRFRVKWLPTSGSNASVTFIVTVTAASESCIRVRKIHINKMQNKN
jgi:hypothetical protein